MSRSVKTFRHFNESSEFLNLSIADLFAVVGVFLLCLVFMRETNISILAFAVSAAVMATLVAVRKGKRRKVIRDGLRRFTLGKSVYDPRNR